MADLLFQNFVLELRVGLDRCSIDLGNYIEGPQITFVSGRVGFNCAYNHAFVRAFKQITDGRIVTERLDADAEPGPHDFVTGDKLSADFLCHVDWDSETQATVHPVNEGVHADHFAVDVTEWTAAVAGINRGVSLQIVRDGVTAAGQQFVPAFAAHYPIGERVIELEGRADRERKLAYAYAVAVAELNDRQIFCVDFNYGDIGLLISAHYPGRKFSAISQFHLDFIRALDHVEVCKDIAVWPNDETRAFTLDRPGSIRIAPLIVFVRGPLEEQIVEGELSLPSFFRNLNNDDARRDGLEDFRERVV